MALTPSSLRHAVSSAASFLPLLVLLSSHSSRLFAAAIDNGLARTPPMGWASWNAFADSSFLNDSAIRGQADAIVANGLNKVGFTSVHIDCGWDLPTRAANNSLVPDPSKFPYGIKAVADYVHSLGLQLGLYTSHHTSDCCGGPGMAGFEALDAQTFVDWGVNFVKIDSCAGHAMNASAQWEEYASIAQTFNATGAPIEISICPTSYLPPGVDAPCIPWGGNESYSGFMWTNGTVVRDPSTISHMLLIEFCNNANSWETVTQILDAQQALVGDPGYSRPGAWLDMDMLTVGCDDGPHPPGFTPCASSTPLSYTEQVSQFSMWSILASPLILGSDLRFLSNATLSILTNAEVIAVNQDPLGYRARLVYDSGGGGGLGGGDGSGSGSGARDGPSAVVMACDGSLSQAWEMGADGSIRSLGTGACLDVWDCETGNGTTVDLFPCHITQPACGSPNSSLNQMWSPVPVPGVVGGGAEANAAAEAEAEASPAPSYLVSALGEPGAGWNSWCLDLYNLVGPQVNLWTCHGTTNQQWVFSGSGSTAKSLSPISDPGKCLSAIQPAPAHERQVYAKIMANGDRAVLLVNRGPAAANVTVTWAMIALGDGPVWTSADVRDLWLHQQVGSNVVGSFTAQVESHGVAMLLVSQASDEGVGKGTRETEGEGGE